MVVDEGRLREGLVVAEIMIEGSKVVLVVRMLGGAPIMFRVYIGLGKEGVDRGGVLLLLLLVLLRDFSREVLTGRGPFERMCE